MHRHVEEAAQGGDEEGQGEPGVERRRRRQQGQGGELVILVHLGDRHEVGAGGVGRRGQHQAGGEGPGQAQQGQQDEQAEAEAAGRGVGQQRRRRPLAEAPHRLPVQDRDGHPGELQPPQVVGVGGDGGHHLGEGPEGGQHLLPPSGGDPGLHEAQGGGRGHPDEHAQAERSGAPEGDPQQQGQEDPGLRLDQTAGGEEGPGGAAGGERDQLRLPAPAPVPAQGPPGGEEDERADGQQEEGGVDAVALPPVGGVEERRRIPGVERGRDPAPPEPAGGRADPEQGQGQHDVPRDGHQLDAVAQPVRPAEPGRGREAFGDGDGRLVDVGHPRRVDQVGLGVGAAVGRLDPLALDVARPAGDLGHVRQGVIGPGGHLQGEAERPAEAEQQEGYPGEQADGAVRGTHTTVCGRRRRCARRRCSARA